MSGVDDLSDVPEGTALAAEYVLGLLEPEARRAAEARMEADPAFAAEVAAWWDRLSPLVDAIPEQAPPADLWRRVEANLGPRGGAASPAPASAVATTAGASTTTAPGERRRGERKRARRNETPRRGVGSLLAAAVAGAVAASAATVAVMVYRDRIVAPAAAPAGAPLLTATLNPEAGEALYVAAYDPARRTVVVTPTRVLPEDGRARELWLIPADGRPRPAGLLSAGPRSTALVFEGELRELAAAGAALAISLEPPGGSPTGAPTGPVIASGALATVG